MIPRALQSPALTSRSRQQPFVASRATRRTHVHAATITKPGSADSISSGDYSTQPVPSAAASPPPSNQTDVDDRTQAQAAKLTAARELARRLAEERLAAAGAEAGAVADPEKKRKAEDASVYAARQAARADALARALRTAETSRMQLAKLQEENLLLKDLLMEIAAGKPEAKAKAQALATQLQSGGPVVAEKKPTALSSKDLPSGPPPAPVEPPAPPRHAELDRLALQASRQSQPVFTFPAGGAVVGTTSQVYYNRTARNVLPEGGGSSGLKVKAGLNKWESVLEVPMRRAPELPRGEWYVADVALPADVYAVDFVVMGPNNAFDNNGSKDYSLPLVDAPTRDQVLEMRTAAFLAEQARVNAMLNAEEQRQRDEIAERAKGVMDKGRLAYRHRRDIDVRIQAEKTAVARRPARLSHLPNAQGRRGVFEWCGGLPQAGQRRLFAFNKEHGPLGRASNVRLHLGSDGWWNNVEQVLDLTPMHNDQKSKYNLGQGYWWSVEVDVPKYAWMLDFVLSDREQRIWENNGGGDFHTRVDGGLDVRALTDAMVASLLQDNAARYIAAEEKAAVQAMNKAKAKGEAVLKRRRAQQQFLYTLPLVPVAGQEVEVHYNPDSTLLRGRPEVFVRASFSRTGAGGRVLRLEPEISGGCGFWRAKLPVPADASTLDLAFSDRESFGADGFVDDNGGLEYHVPVAGGAPQRTLKVVHVAVEMAPIAKVGGMGDVVTALGRAIEEEGHSVEVVIPKYDCINYKQVDQLRQEGSFWHNNSEVRVWKGGVEGLPTTFLEPTNGMFWVGCIYGRNDDANRFDYFCQVALQYMRDSKMKADIVHAHDWQSAPVTWGDRGGAKSVFTIHNLSYGVDRIARAMAACNIATTVSPTYAREISGHASIAPHLPKLYGVLNGIDDDIWDPAVDPDLPVDFGPENVVEGKAAARKVLRQRLGLSQVDVPVVGVVTRLVAQKGIHLIKHAAWRTLERGGQFVLLGSAPDPRVQAEFDRLRDDLRRQYPERAALVFQYDEPLSHLIYAGCDMFLVPSIFEPCGLTQMIAMRYGTVPVVRKTGGLADTVFDVNDGAERAKLSGMAPNGFAFDGTDPAGLDYALNRGLTMFYTDRAAWNRLAASIMTQDWSWNSPALDYIELYFKALK